MRVVHPKERSLVRKHRERGDCWFGKLRVRLNPHVDVGTVGYCYTHNQFSHKCEQDGDS